MGKLVRVLCLAVVFAMMVVSVFACGASKDTSDSTSSSAKTDSKAATEETATKEADTKVTDPFAEPMDILFMAATNDKKIMEENKLVQLGLEKKFNVKLSFSPANYYNTPEEFELIIAAGALPDCGVTSLTVKAPELVQRGAIRTIPVDKAKELAPNYMKYMETKPMMKAWQSKNENEYYGFYLVQPEGGGGGFTTALRLDWMENLGIKPKGNVQPLLPEGFVDRDFKEDKDNDANKRLFVTDAQYTWDEFVSLLDAFTKSDPDQNGENDTYGLATNILEFMDGYWGFHIFPVEGMNFRWVKESNGSAAPQTYSKVYKRFLEMHKELDDKGYLIPKYWSASVEDVWKYYATGKAGATAMATGYVGPSSIPPFSLLTENKDAKVLLIPPTEGRRALDAAFMGGSDIGFFYVNSKVDDAKFDRILRMFDYMYGSDEGWEFCNYGIEGKNFKKENGKYVELKEQNEALPPEERISYGAYCGYMFPRPVPEDLTTRIGIMKKYEKEKWPPMEGYYTFYGPGTQAVLDETAFLKPENTEAKDNAYKEYVLSICEGKADSNTAYEKLMSVLNGMGYQEYLKIVNENMLITEELKKGNMVHPSEIIK